PPAGAASARRSRQHLLVCVIRAMNVHPRALVQADRAGGVLRVDAETDERRTTLLELAERLLKERRPEPAPTPLRQDAEDADPAELGIPRDMPGVDAKACELLSFLGKPAEQGVEVGAVEVVDAPLLVRLRAKAPVLGEGDLVGLVDAALVLPPERAN